MFRLSSHGELPIVEEEELDDVPIPSLVIPTESGYPGPFSSLHEVQVAVEMTDYPSPTSTVPLHPQSQETEV